MGSSTGHANSASHCSLGDCCIQYCELSRYVHAVRLDKRLRLPLRYGIAAPLLISDSISRSCKERDAGQISERGRWRTLLRFNRLIASGSIRRER